MWSGDLVLCYSFFFIAPEVWNLKSNTMGSCPSKLSRNLKAYRKYSSRFGKRRSKITAAIPEVKIKAITDSRSHARDFTVSEFVHLDFEKGGANNRARSEVSNVTFHLKQLQWNHSQIDSNGIFASALNPCNQTYYYIYYPIIEKHKIALDTHNTRWISKTKPRL